MSFPAEVSLIGAGTSLLLAALVGRQFLQRRKPHQLTWTVALLLISLGIGCQFVGERMQWTATMYRIWYVSGAILAAAWLGQGSVYLLFDRRKANGLMVLLTVSSLYALFSASQAPVDLSAALTAGTISGAGMPTSVRILTPFFNIYGTFALVGGAIASVSRTLWHGGNRFRAFGTASIALGSLLFASGGTLARFGLPEPLYFSELGGILLIFAGFKLAEIRQQPRQLSASQLRHRRHTIVRVTVGLGLGLLLLFVVLLPILPWPMGIVADAQHVYTENLPAENKGAYLITDDGVMQLYDWHTQQGSFPQDAPQLRADSLRGFAVVQKQFDRQQAYQLYNFETGQRYHWDRSEEDGLQKFFYLSDNLPAGHYMWRVATDSMFGGSSWHYFQLVEEARAES